jgi:fumarate reductase flavoprotein subunit
MTRLRTSAKADVVVVGAGLAGHCAALSAAESGARVILLEKQRDIGGSTVLSGGFFAFADTPLQRAANISDDSSLLLKDLQEIGGPDAEPALLEAYAEGQSALNEWLSERGASFTALELSAGQSVPRSHRCDIVELIGELSRRLKTYDQAATLVGMPVRRLLRETFSGPVYGVEATDPRGEPYRVLARGGVVLASGGFSRSEKLLRLFAPGQAAALRIGGDGDVGDGLRMAWRLGADLRDMGHVKGTFGTHPNTGTSQHEILLAFYVGAIVVNKDGRRFVDESSSYKELGDACLRQRDHIGFQVFDQAVMERSATGVPLFDFAPALNRGLLIRADSLAELAERIGIPGDALIDTVNRYNAAVDDGHDPDFGRRGLCNGYGALTRIERGPFYVYPSTSVVLATYCGLAITPRAEVKDVEGNIIDGLYAAGELIGGFHGRSYMTGSSLGKAAFFGKVAGAQAAARIVRR